MKLSVVMIALNEEQNVREALLTVKRAVERSGWNAYEIILVNDGSSDGTGKVIHQLGEEFWPQVTDTHLIQNEGPGRAFEAGLGLVTGDRVTCIGADNSFEEDTLCNLFTAAKESRFVLSYISNNHVRPTFRRWISKSYTQLWKTLFQLDLRYINGNAIYPADVVKKIPIRANRHAYSAELTTKLLRMGIPHTEVALKIRSASGFSSAIQPRVLFDTLRTFLWCLIEVPSLRPETSNGKV